MDQKTRDHYRHAVRDVKTAVFVAAWVQEMFDTLDGEIEELREALKGMQNAVEELLAEAGNKRAAKWDIINNACVAASNALGKSES